MEKRELWVDKHAPPTLDDMVIDSDMRKMFEEYVKQKTIPNMLLAGRQGTGKSTLAHALAHDIGATVLYVNAGYESGIEVIRTKVKDFCDAFAFGGALKVVILDEADALSGQGGGGNGASAQGGLRNLIEEASDDTRFIMTCNYVNKIIPALQSRCTPIKVKFTVEDVMRRVVKILKAEKVKFDADTLTAFTARIVKKKFPDVRSIINCLEQWSISGELKDGKATDDQAGDEVVNKILAFGTMREAREWWISNEEAFASDYEALASKVFDALEDPKKQLAVAEGMYRMAVCLDKEIQFAAMVYQLKGS